jgi:apolipoprotein D and lipocalin family protein
MKKEKWLLAAAAGAGAAALIYALWPKAEIPEGATAVEPFDIDRYMGKWLEIARLPNKIEKDIKNLTEEYAFDDDGAITVVTRGYNFKKNKWTEVTGKIKPAGSINVGMLQVSYLRPFYAAYNVLDVDDDYQYALVSGSGLDYLWILSRTTTVPMDIRNRFLQKAAEFGFDVGMLEWGVA